MIESLAPQGTPILQIAADGRWEEAVRVPLPAGRTDVDRAVDEVLRCPLSDLAAEIVWENPVVFVGARYTGHEADDLRERLRVLAEAPDRTPRDALALLAGAPPAAPVRAEVGAVNAWKSVGAVPVDLAAEAGAIDRSLAEHPDLARSGRPLALEVISDEPREAWWAVGVPAAGEEIAAVLRRLA